MSPADATRRHKLPLPENMVITSKRRFSFATENRIIDLFFEVDV
jgi:hypothetical protein